MFSLDEETKMNIKRFIRHEKKLSSRGSLVFVISVVIGMLAFLGLRYYFVKNFENPLSTILIVVTVLLLAVIFVTILFKISVQQKTNLNIQIEGVIVEKYRPFGYDFWDMLTKDRMMVVLIDNNNFRVFRADKFDRLDIGQRVLIRYNPKKPLYCKYISNIDQYDPS